MEPTWLVKIEIKVHAKNRSDAFEKAREIAESLEGGIVSIPQEPEGE